MVEPKGREILDLVEGLDEIIAVGEPGWTEKPAAGTESPWISRAFLKSAWIGWRSRSCRRLGFSAGNLREPAARWFYTETAPPLSEDDHVILKNLRMLELRIQGNARPLSPSVPAALVQAAHERLSALGWNPGLRPVIFNVGAAWPTKRWFPERWTETLRRRTGPGCSRRFSGARRRNDGRPKTSAGRPASLFFPFLRPGNVRLVENLGLDRIGDTFALQAAAAIGLPAVAVFGPTNPRRNGPFIRGPGCLP